MTVRIEVTHATSPSGAAPFLAPAPPGSTRGAPFEGLLVTMEGATPIPAATAPGRYVFEAQPGATVTLGVTVRTPASVFAQRTQVLDMRQSYRVTAGGLTVGQPGGWHGGHAGVSHPRCALPARCAASSGASAGVCIALDLRFLDVTPVLQAGNAHHPLLTSASLFGHEVRFLQYTAGNPPIWMVLLPRSYAAQRAEIPVVFFYRPASMRRVGRRSVPIVYSSVHDVPLGSAVRYFLRASDYDPMSSGRGNNTQPFFVQSEPGLGFQPYPACRFAKQMAQANKNVLLVYPTPIGGDFSDATGGTLLSSIDGVLHALWAGGHVGASVDAQLRRGRLALGGFSHGGRPMWNSLAHGAVRAATSEIYAFDPMGIAHAAGDIQRWHALGGDRKLRLIRGGEWDAVTETGDTYGAPTLPDANLARTGHGAATVWPANRSFYLDSDVYRSAYRYLGFRGENDPAPADPGLSDLTGLFLSAGHTPGANSTVMVVKNAADETVGAPIERRGSYSEHAGIAAVNMRLGMRSNRGLRDAWSRTLPQSGYWLRHQWTVCGGQSASDEMESFVGYLELCLANSGF
jgi:hypothetical protein